MNETPDIGGLLFKKASDAYSIETPFGYLNLPSDWYLLGINVSPTKHVVFMVLAAALVLLCMWLAARSIERSRRAGTAPRGFGSAIEAMVLFVRNDIAIANIGHHGAAFAPYILTLFFFILFCNLLGLVPWGSTATGNLAVTGALALTAFAVIEISGFRTLGPKGYLRTIVVVPKGVTGVGAVLMAAVMTPVELIGKFVKPFALCLRLFANMTAGSFVLLAFMGLIFIFGTVAYVKWAVAGFSVVFTLFMLGLKTFIAFLQAYIFALLTSVFIGLMQHEH